MHTEESCGIYLIKHNSWGCNFEKRELSAKHTEENRFLRRNGAKCGGFNSFYFISRMLSLQLLAATWQRDRRLLRHLTLAAVFCQCCLYDKVRSMIMMIRQFVRRRNMSMKSLQGRRTTGSRDECRTAPDGRRPLDQAHGLEPLARLCLRS